MLVVGAGTIGVLAAIAAKAKGATVYISDVSEGKLEMAKEFGVDGTLLNDSPEHFDKRVAELTEGNGFDVTIEAVGLPSTFQNCIDACCFRWTVSGLPYRYCSCCCCSFRRQRGHRHKIP